MDCTNARTLLHGYIDQELDLASMMAIDQHLESCGKCKEIYAQQTMLRSAIRQHGEYHTAPAALAERIRAQIDATDRPAPAKQSTRRWTWPEFGRWFQVGAAVAATAVVTWTTALQFGGQDLVAEQVISGHARSVLTSHLTDVATSDRHTVKPWLSSKLDFSPRVTDLTTAGFPLAGGRLDYLDGRPVAALVYHRRQHVINLFVWPDPKAEKTLSTKTLSRNGYHLVHWGDSGMTYWAISDLDSTELKDFAEQYAGAK
jgi:mycothiol system anti-sigma-R factor